MGEGEIELVRPPFVTCRRESDLGRLVPRKRRNCITEMNSSFSSVPDLSLTEWGREGRREGRMECVCVCVYVQVYGHEYKAGERDTRMRASASTMLSE